ncbi:ubiquitin-conjugating enzyme E2s, partial [Dimargaris cristalligena]
ENLAPTAIRKIIKELQGLEQNPHEGIHVVTNEEDITDIQAWVAGPEGTPYQNGFFRIKLQLGSDFPNMPPQCWFLTKIFHPNVSGSGEVCVSTLKKDWKKELGIGHILLTVKCLLIVPNPESALNEEAGRLLLEQYDDYAKHARLMTDIH